MGVGARDRLTLLRIAQTLNLINSFWNFPLNIFLPQLTLDSWNHRPWIGDTIWGTDCPFSRSRTGKEDLLQASWLLSTELRSPPGWGN